MNRAMLGGLTILLVCLFLCVAHAHQPQNWTTHVYYSSDVTPENYHVISTQYAGVDAPDITNSRKVTVKNCFFRSCDGCIQILICGWGRDKKLPALYLTMCASTATS